jgi:hypothetical protein
MAVFWWMLNQKTVQSPRFQLVAVVARVVGADSAGVRKISSTCWREGGFGDFCGL